MSAAPGILFVSAPPHDHVLLMHSTGQDGGWTLPDSIDEVGADIFLDEPAEFGNAKLARVDVQFAPTLSSAHDDFCWITPDFGLTCSATEPNAAAVLKQFIAGRGDSQSHGEDFMEPRSAFIEAQAKAQRVAQLFNDSADPPVNGESLLGYRQRLASKFKAHSKAYAGSDLSKVGCPNAMSVVEDQIFSAAMDALNSGALVPAGQMRPIIKMDGAGRPITHYVASDEGVCWNQFAPPIRYVRRILTPGTPLAS